MYKNYRYSELSQKSEEVGIIFDVMVTGVTGAGKSTTLNTIFQKEVAKVGKGVDPETMELNSYLFNNCFRLWDTPGLGDGIEKDKLKYVTDRLYRADESRNKKINGFGLGLSIVQKVANLHNAKLRIISKPHKGTTVILIFQV